MSESELEQGLINLLTEVPVTDINRRYLAYLRNVKKFNPSVIYDIGASIGSYAKFNHILFPNSKIILFEADDFFIPRYKGEDYHIVCLGDEDNKEVTFFNETKNGGFPQAHSCYPSSVLNIDVSKVLKTCKLDTIVKEKSLPKPDLIKINASGSELDIIKGGIEIIKEAKYLIVNLQNTMVYYGAPLAKDVGPYVESLGFEVEEMLDSYGNGMIDYIFKNKKYI
jgi:FkbM family methyltransferase